MSSYQPPVDTYPPQQLRPEANRARTTSATAERYRPRTYSNPPPSQPNPALLGPHQHPYPPSGPMQDAQQHPPYPEQGDFVSPQGPIPMPQPEIGYANQSLAPGPSSRHNSYTHTRPPMDEDYDRRPSYSSQHSHHSHHSHDSRHSRDDSRRSHESKHSRHSRHSADDRHDGKHHGDKTKKAHPHRTNERPTMGDSLISMFGLIKSALGPRDKA